MKHLGLIIVIVMWIITSIMYVLCPITFIPMLILVCLAAGIAGVVDAREREGKE